MSSAGTAKQPLPEPKRRTKAVALLSLAAFAFILITVDVWQNGGRERLLVLLQPQFTVTQIDPSARTMTLSRVEEKFTVSCGDWCGSFAVGRSYSMRKRGPVLDFTINGKKIELPIVQEHFDLETPPAGHG
ncbi:MAG TPA: hypothetical protein VEI26_04535 [Terriglobales bacterium]|nr:hypothetical protein [Terriglobales bacterium]